MRDRSDGALRAELHPSEGCSSSPSRSALLDPIAWHLHAYRTTLGKLLSTLKSGERGGSAWTLRPIRASERTYVTWRPATRRRLPQVP